MDEDQGEENVDERSSEVEDSTSSIRFDFAGSCGNATSSSRSSYGGLDSNMKTSVAIQIPTSQFLPLQQPTHSSMANSSSVATTPVPAPNDDENANFPWLQALELHAVGACRTDERLRPVLRWNVSCFGSNGRILSSLGLHFKAKELAMLARCLCTPLVSIRVGKVSAHDRLLCPTSIRGQLSLTMLPSSTLRLSFREDDGTLERLSQMTPCTEDPPVVLEPLPADTSSRSFVLKLPENRLAFFWQSEKSKAAGDELVLKMKDFLMRRPTLSQLTGIPESRLQTLASYINCNLITWESTSTSLSTPCRSTSVSTRTSESSIIPPTTPSSRPTTGTVLLPSSSSSGPASQIDLLCSQSLPIAVSFASSLLVNTTASAAAAAAAATVAASSTSGIISSLLAGDDGNGNRNLFMEVDRDAFAERLLGSLPRSLVPFPLLRVSGTTAAGSMSPRLPASSGSVLTPCYCPCPLGNVSALQCTFTPPFLPSLPASDHHLPSSAPPSSLVADLYSSLPFPSLLSSMQPKQPLVLKDGLPYDLLGVFPTVAGDMFAAAAPSTVAGDMFAVHHATAEPSPVIEVLSSSTISRTIGSHVETSTTANTPLNTASSSISPVPRPATICHSSSSSSSNASDEEQQSSP